MEQQKANDKLTEHMLFERYQKTKDTAHKDMNEMFLEQDEPVL